MKSLIVYSSLTGNTKKVAEAIAEIIPGSEIYPVENAPSPEGYDFIALGYWVDKGMPSKQCLDYLAGIKNKKLALFGTLGAWPDSDHAKECMEKSEALAADGTNNTVLGSFLCQGKVDPKIIEMMQKHASAAHPMTPERIARIEEAKKHPDQQDCLNAQKAFKDFFAAAQSQ